MTLECAFCERSVGEKDSVRLLHKSDVTICFDCLNWLNSRRDRHVRAASGGWVVSGYEPVFVVADMPAAADHYKSSDSTSAPENKPWGKYERSHVDPDGNIIRFGSPHRDEG